MGVRGVCVGLWVTLCVGVVLNIFCSNGLGRTVILSDFDNTIVETRQPNRGTFKTGFKVFRIDQRSSVIEPVPRGPKELVLSPVDYHRLYHDFGKGPGLMGSPLQAKLETGEKIVPGQYMVRNPDTFEYFLSDPSGERNFLLEDYEAAKEREGQWRGPYFAAMQAILSTAQSAQTFGVISARGQPGDWRALFEAWLREGHIRHLPNFDLFHNISWHTYDQYSTVWNVPEQKVAVLEQVALRLGRVPFTEGDEVAHPDDPSRKGRFHVLTFVDDNQHTLELAVAKAQELSRSKVVPVKFQIFNMGLKSEIRDAQRPQFAVVTTDGQFRHATPLEKLGEPRNLPPEVLLEFDPKLTCDTQVASLGEGE